MMLLPDYRRLMLNLTLVVMFAALAACGEDSGSGQTTTENINAPTQFSGTPAAICEENTPAPEPTTRQYTGPENVLEEGVDYYALLCTGSGPIVIDLYETLTPVTVNNFVFLANRGYYNNTMFHRVIQNFMAQGGDPTGTGMGGPGYTFQDEFVSDLRFNRPGLLAMANSGRNTNGSQFFLTTGVADWLDGMHTIFGEVISGYDQVLLIRYRDPQTDPQPGTSLDTVLIITNIGAITLDEG